MYPRSAGGLEGRLRPAVRGGMTLWKRAHDGSEFNSSFSFFFFFFFFKHRSKFAHHLLHTLPERAGDALDSYAFCIFFVFCFLFFVVALLYLPELHLPSDTATISPWAITFFSLSKRILKNLTEQGKKKKEELAGFKLSTKSKLYVHDMSEAMLTALSVCSASAKPIVVFVSFSPFFSSS